MRRHLLAAFSLGSLLAGCSQTQLAPNARIIGTNGLAQVGDLLFVTSTDRAELRALDLKASTRDFIRAPNPLEALSIPVLDRPVSLVRDLRYDENGQEVTGPYLYAQGEAAQEISIVGTDRATQLVELARVPVGGVVTAIAARGPAAAGQPSTLYYATLKGSEGSLWELAIPSPSSSGKISAPIDPNSARRVYYGPSQSATGNPITALLVLPNNRLVVASRDPVSKVGRTIVFVVLDPRTPAQQAELKFASTCGPSGNQPCPVRLLATHPTTQAEGSPPLDAGSRVFGVLDEDACATLSTCTGVVAVDTAPNSPRLGQIALDKTGNPMVPMMFGSSLVTGLTVVAGAKLNVPTSDQSPLQLSQLGIISTSAGYIYFFDASALRFIDIGGDVAKVKDPARDLLYQYTDSSGNSGVAYSTAPQYIPGPRFETIKVAHGAALDETVRVTYQGVITGLRDLATMGGSDQVAVDPSLITRVAVGDRVTFTNCIPAEAGVSQLNPAGSPSGTLKLALPPGTDTVQCTDSANFSVRAAGAQPYVVEGTGSGYMGRTSDGTSSGDQVFAFPADVAARKDRYYFHPADYDPTAPQIQFSMGLGDPNIVRGALYAMNVFSNYAPEYALVDIGIGVEFHLPSTSAYVTTVSSGDIFSLFVSYPSANAILEINPQTFLPNRPISRSIQAYR